MKKFDDIEAAVSAIRAGEMVVVLDDEDRENEGDLIIAAEKITPKAVNFMAKHGRGLVCAPISDEIADKLALQPMVPDNREPYKCNFTVSVDLRDGITTGISASDRAKTILALADDGSRAADFVRPGHVFPLIARKGGVLVRAGHTEAATDLAELAGLKPAGVLCEIARDDGEMMRTEELLEFAKEFDLRIITIRDLIAYRMRTESLVECVAMTNLPTKHGVFEMRVYKNMVDDTEHIVMSMGDVAKADPVLVRVHSQCVTSEVFGSLKCDCDQQLSLALDRIAEEGVGVLLYMAQEGRGIGLVNKVKAYHLQEEGADTVEANHKLGFEDDLRDYGLGAQILADLGCSHLRLMTNNPRKIVGLEGYGMNVVERCPIQVRANEINRGYLETKKHKLGHILDRI